MSEIVDTTLITPLAAYLDLRTRGRAAFLLESVDRGRLGRHSFVGCGDRIVTVEEAELIAEPVVGYLGYDHVATLEPTTAAVVRSASSNVTSRSPHPTNE